MCGAALTLVAAGFQAYSQYQQGQQQKAMANYQSQVAANNAIVAEQNAQIQDRAAQDALSRGRIEEQQQRLRTAQMIGSQRSALAASGVQVDSGSALDVIGDTAMMGEQDALIIQSNAEREAYNYRVGAWNYRNQASALQAESAMQRSAGKAAARNGMMSAGMSLLGGANSAYNSYSSASSFSDGSPRTTGSVAWNTGRNGRM